MLELEHVHKFYSSPGAPIHAIDDVCLSVEAGEFVAIFGPSGSGKSTLLGLTSALIKPDSGRVIFEGEDIGQLSKRETYGYRRTKLGTVSQSFNLMGGLTVEENVGVPLRLLKVQRSEARRRVRAILSDVGLSQRGRHEPDRLSGGEQQRVAIARALVGRPRLILADEPTGNLDSATGEQVLKLFCEMARNHGAGAIVVTHDPVVATFADRVLGMRDGRLMRYDPVTQAIATSG